MYLLPVVFGEVPQLSQPGNEGVMKVPSSSSSLPAPPLTPDCAIYPECICSDSDQQHQFLHVCTRRLRHLGGERSACSNDQRRRRLRAVPGEGEDVGGACCRAASQSRPPTLTTFLRLLPSEDPDRDIDGVRRRHAPELPAGLQRVAAASRHRVSLLLLGRSLLPVHL